MLMSKIRLNWGIYESDITYIGGRVVYTGEYLDTRGNVLEKAYIVLNGITCEVCMERFRKGNAVISDFVRKDEYGNAGADIEAFLDAYYDCIDQDEKFMMNIFWRRTKQYLTVLAQVLCVVILGFSIYAFSLHRYHPVLPITLVACSICLFFALGTLYEYYRNMCPK